MEKFYKSLNLLLNCMMSLFFILCLLALMIIPFYAIGHFIAKFW